MLAPKCNLNDQARQPGRRLPRHRTRIIIVRKSVTKRPLEATSQPTKARKTREPVENAAPTPAASTAALNFVKVSGTCFYILFSVLRACVLTRLPSRVGSCHLVHTYRLFLDSTASFAGPDGAVPAQELDLTMALCGDTRHCCRSLAAFRTPCIVDRPPTTRTRCPSL